MPPVPELQDGLRLSNLGIIEIFLLVGLLFIVIPVWGIVDAAKRPDYAWSAAGQNKVLWIALQAAGAIFTGFGGVVMAVVYLVAIRPMVRAAEVTGAHRAARPPGQSTPYL